VIRAVKRGLDRLIDVLIPVALVLFILVLVFYVRDWIPFLNGQGSPSVQAQAPAPWTGYGERHLSSPDEAMPQAPLPFVPYSSTVTMQDPFVPVPTPAPGTLEPTRLVIPSIQLDTPVKEVTIENGVWQVAQYAAGYHRGTARPGTVGNTVISGHKGMFGAVFYNLEEVNVGDEVFLYAGPRLYRYVVEDKKSVWPNQTEVMDQTPNPILTLITCTAYDTQRLVVVARLDRELTTGVEAGP
jgi:sortase A